MRGVKTVLAILSSGSLILSGGVALPSTGVAKTAAGSKASMTQTVPKPEVRRASGEVTAVEPSANPMTLTMKSMEGKQELTIGVDVTGKTMIREGKARKTLSDIKVGDRVWMKYERTNDRLVADSIRILKPTHMAAKSAANKRGY